jgi:SpoVK/Ycf46/Vps4 family AAA+-type ATPase
MENAPSVIFIDEFQALFTSRDGGSGSSRLASTLLQCMDDIAKWTSVDKSIAKNQNSHFDLNSNRVVVLAATNTPWMVDKAFLRTGRFDRVVHVGLPNETERQSILKVHIERMKLHESTSIEEICSTLVPLTIGFSGADIAALTRSAAVQCLNDRNADNALGVQSKHFQAARQFDVTEPSSNKELVSRLQKWKP